VLPNSQLKTTTAIARYLARINPLTKLYSDNIFEIESVIENTISLQDPKNVSSVLQGIENLVSSKKAKFLLGNSLTLADLVLWETIQVFNVKITTPSLKQLMSEIEKLPQLQQAKSELLSQSNQIHTKSKEVQPKEKVQIKESKEKVQTKESKEKVQTKTIRLIQYDQEVTHYVVKVMRDFNISREEAEEMWVKFMDPIGKVKYIKNQSSGDGGDTLKLHQIEILTSLKGLDQRVDVLEKKFAHK